MKNYLNYQSSEYDCGSVSITNGIRYLFDREETSPDILKCIMLYTMDTYNEQGQPCRHGTSAAAMRFVGSWLNQLAAVRSFPIQTQFLFGNDVTLSPDSEISQALLHGAAVVLRLFLEVPHYVSAGALNYTPVAKVTNIGKTIEELKAEGMWFVCADMDGEMMYNLDLKGPIGLVIGNEGEGVSRLVKEKCDFVASIPMKGDIDSLNASVAAGVLAFEIVRQRLQG